MSNPNILEICDRYGLTPIPLKPRSKVPLVKWGNSWRPTPQEMKIWAQKPVNWGVRCDDGFAALDFDSEAAYHDFVANHKLPSGCPIVKTPRGTHVWLKPKKPVSTQYFDEFELRASGSYVVSPPSIHPSGIPYTFIVKPNGNLPVVDIEDLLKNEPKYKSTRDNKDVPIQNIAPSSFAMKYGRSPYPQSMCGLATKIFSRSDGEKKKLISLRCWGWNCPKCAPLLRRYWQAKLDGILFRFIIELPTMAKPTTFLRRIGKPGYTHIVNNGRSWLFITAGEVEKVKAEVNRAGYKLVAWGDNDITEQETIDYLEQALCQEEKPLNRRRKITHSRGLIKKPEAENQDNDGNESIEKDDPDKALGFGGEPLTWNSEVVMKTIEEVAKELKMEGWHISWLSEVEALATKGKEHQNHNQDIVEAIENLGVKLKQKGQGYMGLCPFHDDHNPSLSVNKEKGVWHCFGCGKSGDLNKFMKEWQANGKQS
ncbi:CHC2 zinc finger domain-containing protein [Chloroflexota bacterium]